MRHVRMDKQAEAYTGRRSLYRVGGAAAITMAVLIPIQIMILVVWPPPSTVIGWFTLFEKNKLIGLLDMDLLLIVDQVLIVMVILALYIALRRPLWRSL